MSTEPNEKFLTRKEVLETVKVGTSTLYRWMEQNRFPRPLKFTAGCVRWKESAVKNWLSSQEEMRAVA